MTVIEFWNSAFLAALSRLPVAHAKEEADLATEACLDRWKSEAFNHVQVVTRFGHMPLVSACLVPRSSDRADLSQPSGA